MPTVDGRKVDFEEAIGFFRDKLQLPSRRWTDLWEGQHARAFVIAGARHAGLIEDFYTAVRRGLAEGVTVEEFRKDFDAIVKRHGWSYKGGRNWRSRVIFETNVSTAYAAGRWEQIQRLKGARPWLRYVSVLDALTRPEHAAWHGTVLHADHPWWRTHYPPNGWYCRCTVMQLSDEDLEEFGYKVSGQAPDLDWEDRIVNTDDGPVTLRVPKGIDTGWSYNVGEAAFGRGADLLAQERHGGWDDLFAPGGNKPARPGPLATVPSSVRLGRRAGNEAALRQALRDVLGAEARIFEDPAGVSVEVNQSLVDHILAAGKQDEGREAYFPLIPELIERPQEIWVGFAQSQVSGRVDARRRYVRRVAIGGGRTVTLVADLDGGRWSGLTFFQRRGGSMNRLRSGLRVYSDAAEG